MTEGNEIVNKVAPVAPVEKKNEMESDLFVDEGFIYYKEICVISKSDPSIVNKYKFGLKEITGFEEDKISKSAMNINGRTGKMEINQSEANIQFLMASIVEAPFTINEANLRNLSKKIRDELLDFARTINEVTDDTEKK